jgi:hypothetical protein
MDFLGKLMGAFGKKPSWDATTTPANAFLTQGEGGFFGYNGLTEKGKGAIGAGLGAFGKMFGERGEAAVKGLDGAFSAPPSPGGADPSAQIASSIMARRGAFGPMQRQASNLQRAAWMPSRR